MEESKTEEPRDPITAVISHTIPDDADEDTKEGYLRSFEVMGGVILAPYESYDMNF